MDRMLRACLNWKVIGGLTALGLGLWVVAPNLLAAALPVLLLAVCPLSMVLMMRGMQGEHGSEQRGTGPESGVTTSPAVERAKLQAMREEIDRRIEDLESVEADPQPSHPAADTSKQPT